MLLHSGLGQQPIHFGWVNTQGLLTGWSGGGGFSLLSVKALFMPVRGSEWGRG